MVWLGDSQHSLAGALITLYHELVAAYPDQEWQNSAGTGTIGDLAHIAEGSASDHNPWLNNTVRAMDIALTAKGPSCEALFAMGNAMYARHDPRIFPDGYTIFNGRITDWNNPGGFHPQQGDPHTGHVHISVSTNPAGYNATNAWPPPVTASPPPPIPLPVPGHPTVEEPMIVIFAPNGGIAEKVPGGKYHLDLNEWNAVKELHARLPGAVVYTSISIGAWTVLAEKRGKL